MLPVPRGCNDVPVQVQTCFNQLHLYYMAQTLMLKWRKIMQIGKPCGLQLLRGEMSLSHLGSEQKYR